LSKNSEKFSTIAIRPRALIGAEDTVIFPRILTAYKHGKLKIVGNGQNICDLTCVRNVIEAIVCCLNASKNAYGQAYNITNDEPVKFWQSLNFVLTELGFEKITKNIPHQIAMLAATFIEMNAKLFKHKKEPALTCYGVGVLSENFTLDISKAKNNINYKPVQTTIEGLNEFIKWYKQMNM